CKSLVLLDTSIANEDVKLAEIFAGHLKHLRDILRVSHITLQDNPFPPRTLNVVQGLLCALTIAVVINQNIGSGRSQFYINGLSYSRTCSRYYSVLML